jgi:hypothetical protein
LKIAFIKSHSLRAFPTKSRACSNSLIIYNFDLNKILMKKLFNIQQLLNHRSKHYETTLSCTLLMEGFPMAPRARKRCHDWEIST